jgi:hypothetical protein
MDRSLSYGTVNPSTGSNYSDHGTKEQDAKPVFVRFPEQAYWITMV